MKKLLLGLLIFLSLNAYAGTEGWMNADGTPVPNSDAVKSVNGFGGWLVVTPDADWEKKWNTAPESAPTFTGAEDVSYGEELTVLIFYINPKTRRSGEIDILCDIKVTRPDGTASTDEKAVRCAKGKFQGDPNNIRLSEAVIKYMGEAADPPGQWIVEVTLTDRVRGTSIPLKTRFTLRKKA